jgi:hypothetical protein
MLLKKSLMRGVKLPLELLMFSFGLSWPPLPDWEQRLHTFEQCLTHGYSVPDRSDA